MDEIQASAPGRCPTPKRACSRSEQQRSRRLPDRDGWASGSVQPASARGYWRTSGNSSNAGSATRTRSDGSPSSQCAGAPRSCAPRRVDPASVIRTKALGSERMERKLRDALPGGDGALRTAVWEFVRPMLSPALVALNRDAFVIEERVDTAVDLDGHRAAPCLDERALNDEQEVEEALGSALRDPSSRPGHQARGGRTVHARALRDLSFFVVMVDPARGVGRRATPRLPARNDATPLGEARPAFTSRDPSPSSYPRGSLTRRSCGSGTDLVRWLQSEQALVRTPTPTWRCHMRSVDPDSNQHAVYVRPPTLRTLEHGHSI